MSEESIQAKPAGRLANLLVIARFTTRYRGHVVCALIALLVAAMSTVAIPQAFKLIIDRGFGAHGGDLGLWFNLLLLLVVLPIVFLGRRVRSIARQSQDRVADVGAMVDEVLGAMKIVQAFGQEEREAGRFRAAVERVFDTARRRIRVRAVMTVLVIS